MRELNQYELKTCALQAEFFQATPELFDCGSSIAIRRFMNSRLAMRIDGSDLLSDTITPCQMAHELEEQYGVSAYGTAQYGAEQLYWIGYVYRFWCIACGIPSKAAYRIAPAREMAALYYPYHSLDPAQAVERILESKGLATSPIMHSDGYIEEGVAALREMRERSHYEYCYMRI